ncbi:MAG: hypothetical protein Q9159_004552 [Coniocarpon cinnabarinum]
MAERREFKINDNLKVRWNPELGRKGRNEFVRRATKKESADKTNPAEQPGGGGGGGGNGGGDAPLPPDVPPGQQVLQNPYADDPRDVPPPPAEPEYVDEETYGQDPGPYNTPVTSRREPPNGPGLPHQASRQASRQPPFQAGGSRRPPGRSASRASFVSRGPNPIPGEDPNLKQRGRSASRARSFASGAGRGSESSRTPDSRSTSRTPSYISESSQQPRGRSASRIPSNIGESDLQPRGRSQSRSAIRAQVNPGMPEQGRGRSASRRTTSISGRGLEHHTLPSELFHGPPGASYYGVTVTRELDPPQTWNAHHAARFLGSDVPSAKDGQRAKKKQEKEAEKGQRAPSQSRCERVDVRVFGGSRAAPIPAAGDQNYSPGPGAYGVNDAPEPTRGRSCTRTASVYEQNPRGASRMRSRSASRTRSDIDPGARGRSSSRARSQAPPNQGRGRSSSRAPSNFQNDDRGPPQPTRRASKSRVPPNGAANSYYFPTVETVTDSYQGNTRVPTRKSKFPAHTRPTDANTPYPTRHSRAHSRTRSSRSRTQTSNYDYSDVTPRRRSASRGRNHDYSDVTPARGRSASRGPNHRYSNATPRGRSTSRGPEQGNRFGYHFGRQQSNAYSNSSMSQADARRPRLPSRSQRSEYDIPGVGRNGARARDGRSEYGQYANIGREDWQR